MTRPEKIPMMTKNVADENIEKIRALFPNCVTEITENGDSKLTIDFDKLKQELSNSIAGEQKERYKFTWPDKSKSIILANSPTTKTLRPCRNESIDFDITKNIYIEGDNLDALKCLREAYFSKVKMIYIDPPYNTGNDFIYRDQFLEKTKDYIISSQQVNESGNRLFTNLETNGRFHSDWLNMIFPRLKIARDFLSDDGVIFISIDDHELANLRKICDEIFGESNFIATLVWERAYSPKNDAKYISNNHDYILMFAKNIASFKIGRLPRTEEANSRYTNPDNDPRGPWKSSDLSVKTYNASTDYPITTPSGRIVNPPSGGCWRLTKEAFEERLRDNRIWFGANGNAVPSIKKFLNELKNEGMAPTSILFYKDVGHSQEGVTDLLKVFQTKIFDGPKPLRLIERLMTLANLNDDSIVLDFFSGSATTAHALLRFNREKEKHCKFICIQIPQEIPEDRNPLNFDNIANIGLERIRRVSEDYKKAPILNKEIGDLGVRVFRLDESNMNPVLHRPIDAMQENLFEEYENIKKDRTSEDLLIQVMLMLGITLDTNIERKVISGMEVFDVAKGFLLSCFNPNVTDKVITEIAKNRPVYAIFRDSCFISDSVADNFEQIFKTYSPDTICKVI